jgi:cytochrome c-type protein NapB
VPDSEIGLASGTAFEQPEQKPIAFNNVDPGESELRPRPNADFPPAIPHTVDDLETITLTENSCFDCHDPEAAADMGAVAIPASHQVDIRRSPDVTGKEVVGSRWVCTSCHVAQTDTEPLVANR